MQSIVFIQQTERDANNTGVEHCFMCIRVYSEFSIVMSYVSNHRELYLAEAINCYFFSWGLWLAKWSKGGLERIQEMFEIHSTAEIS